MKAVYKSVSGRIQVELEADNPVQLFQRLAWVSPIVELPSCGKCGEVGVQLEARDYEGNRYFNARCPKCRAQLDFHQHKNTPTFYTKSDEHPESSGWYVYKKQNSTTPSDDPPPDQIPF